jgi:hypothetical protein
MTELPESWQRFPHESFKAYEAFHIYIKLRAERTAAEVARQLSKSSALIRRWHQKYNWDDRARAWDAQELNMLRAAQEKEAQALAKVVSQRQKDLIEAEWQHVLALIERVKQMVKWPLSKQTAKEVDETLPDEISPDGKTIKRVTIKKITEIHPARWDFGTMNQMIELVSRLGRLATGAPIAAVGVDHQHSGEVQVAGSLDLDITDADRDAVFQRLHAAVTEQILRERGLSN